MSKLTKIQAADLQIFHDDQMKQMQAPRTAEIRERHDELAEYARIENYNLNTAQIDRGILLDRLNEVEARFNQCSKNYKELAELWKTVESKLERVRGLPIYTIHRVEMGEEMLVKYVAFCDLLEALGDN